MLIWGITNQKGYAPMKMTPEQLTLFPKELLKNCLFCEEEFLPLRSDAKTCSGTCRTKLCTQRKLEREALEEINKEV